MNANANTMRSASLATATLRLVDAEATFERARRRLHAEQRATVLGSGDDGRLDDAVLAFRSARRLLDAARAGWRDSYAAAGAAGATGIPDGEPAAEPEAAETRFVRWLLEATASAAPALAA